jgi:hypothetical protein
MVKKMNVPLIIDEKEPKWVLLGKILDSITSRRVEQELAKQGITPVNLAGAMDKIVLIAMFFSLDITYVVIELHKRRELRSFAKLEEIPEVAEIYRVLGRFSEKQFVDGFLGILSSICVKKGRRRALIVDSNDVSLDLNWFKRKIKWED